MIGDNIKKLREEHGLSQRDLAEIAGVTDKAVSTWELGKKNPRMGAIEKIANYFNIPKSRIIDDSINSNSAAEWENVLKKEFVKHGVINEGDDISNEQYEKAMHVLKILFSSEDRE